VPKARIKVRGEDERTRHVLSKGLDNEELVINVGTEHAYGLDLWILLLAELASQ